MYRQKNLRGVNRNLNRGDRFARGKWPESRTPGRPSSIGQRPSVIGILSGPTRTVLAQRWGISPGLPTRGTGLITGTARINRGRGVPLSDAERAIRHPAGDRHSGDDTGIVAIDLHRAQLVHEEVRPQKIQAAIINAPILTEIVHRLNRIARPSR